MSPHEEASAVSMLMFGLLMLGVSLWAFRRSKIARATGTQWASNALAIVASILLAVGLPVMTYGLGMLLMGLPKAESKDDFPWPIAVMMMAAIALLVINGPLTARRRTY